MANTTDFIDWRGDLSFDIAPFNDIDCFICAELSYPDYTGIADTKGVTVSEAAERYFSTYSGEKGSLGVLQSAHVLPMFRQIADCPRYKDIVIEGFENIIDEANDEQFSAVTLLLPNGTMVIAFRGTDDTICGWNEDFNIAIKNSVPAQLDAVDYVIRHSAGFCGDIILTGHSKGGNLAVYAAVNVPEHIGYRISQAVSFDGPGFRSEFFETEEYKQRSGIIRTLMPQHSLVGVILETAGEPVILNSTTAGPMSHDGFNWLVNKDGFITVDELSAPSRAYKKALNTLVSDLGEEDMGLFIDELFTTLDSTEADTITELMALKPAARIELAGKILKGKRVNSFTMDFLENFVKSFR